MRTWLTRWAGLSASFLSVALLILVANPALIVMGSETFLVPLETWGLLAIVAISISIAVSLPLSLLGTTVSNGLSLFFRCTFIALFLVTIFYPEGGRRLDGVQATVPSTEYLTTVYGAYLAVIAVLLLLYRLHRELITGAFGLFLVSCLGITAYVAVTHTAPGDEQTAPDLSYGSRQNVVFVLADMLQGSTVEQIFNHRPDLKPDYAGFHVFTRGLSPFPFTNYGLPSILSGKLYAADPSLGYLDNLQAARSDSFITDAEKRGFQVTVTGFDELPVSPSQYSYPRDDSTVFLAAMLADLGLTRLTKVPGVLEDVGIGDRMIIKLKRESLAVLDDMTEAPVGPVPYKLIVHHNFVPHSPNYYGVENLNQPKLDWRPKRLDIDNYLDETAFFFGRLAELLEHLRALGIYDSSMIVITGDHGHFVGGQAELYRVVPGAESFKGYERGGWGRAASMYNPAIMIKPPDAGSEVTISHDPISVTDLRALIRRYLDEGPEAPRKTDMSFPTDRINSVVVFPSSAGDPYRTTDDHVVLEVDGNADELAAKFVANAMPLGEYQAGSTLVPPNSILGGNWLKEEKGAWLQGHVGRAHFRPAGAGDGNLTLTVVATPLTNTVQRVSLTVNGTGIGQMEFSKPKQTVSIGVPDSVINADTEEVVIEFEPHDAVSPAELGLWDFASPISIYIYEFSLSVDA